MNPTFQKAAFRLRHTICGGLLSLWRRNYLRVFGMRIGRHTYLGRLTVAWPHKVNIGDCCLIEEDVSFKFDGIWCPGAAIIIGDGVFIGRGCEFNIRKRITVGKGCAIASGCKFIDHDHGITGERIDETPGAEQEIVIGDYVWLGCNVIVLKGISIGSSAVVAAGAVVTKNIPTGEIWAGVPARKISSRTESGATSNKSNLLG